MPLLLLAKLWHDHHVSRDGLHYWPVLHKWSFLHYIYIHHSPCAVPSINPSGFSRPFPLYKWEPLFSLPFQRDHKFLCVLLFGHMSQSKRFIIGFNVILKSKFWYLQITKTPPFHARWVLIQLRKFLNLELLQICFSSLANPETLSSSQRTHFLQVKMVATKKYNLITF